SNLIILEIFVEMKFGKKYIAITAVVILLIIPIFFGIYIDFLIVRFFSLEVVLLFLVGFVFLLGLGKIIEVLLYNDRSREKMKQNDVVNGLLNEKNIIVLLVFFTLIMIMEELIFRYYLIGLLLNQLMIGIMFSIILSSIIFSISHIHIWFRYRDIRITVSYFISSFLLGIYNAFALLTLGIFACIIIHTVLVFVSYYNLYKKLS
ncbi:MAG: type II CAAX prenyl endopeptidase Rce1 family protein, partial [Promethearchaeota archaeon]